MINAVTMTERFRIACFRAVDTELGEELTLPHDHVLRTGGRFCSPAEANVLPASWML
jgi:hypothetical protein